MSTWRQGWQATKQAHRGISFFWGIDVMMGAVGGVIGALLVPSQATRLEQALYPSIGTVVGIVIGVLLILLVFAAKAFVRQSMTTLVTNIVTQVSVQKSVTIIRPYPMPIEMSDMTKGIPALKYLLHQGMDLEEIFRGAVGDASGLRSNMEEWLQDWLDRLQSDVWEYLPNQAQYILSDEGFEIERDVKKYAGWDATLAYRRAVLDRRLGRLREICSHIPELHMADSPSGEAE